MAGCGSFAVNFTAPDRSPRKEELPLSEDRDFAAKGKAMMLVVVLLFASLFIFLVVLACMKHRHIRGNAHGDDKPAGYPELQPPFQFPKANQLKGYSARSGENLHNMSAHQTV
ncbi:hypothetical protein EUGRSUZ_A00598 [Eucalyptus grandis]|uniref:Uncharacterized protein n=2 Tax=Eucalyptus grandis TaxID=71139 RepID=A0A059DCS1_EUCGR|nr:hypothetical protein EUGRSUZ_A00598 [Eucalyptus grandis]